MSCDRQHQMSDLYHAALGRAPEKRGAFSEEACDGDAALPEEMESLLRYESNAARFLETPAAFLASDTSPSRIRLR
jgi:hypothetical protein